ncbi:carboxyphosphonoenolpyruvate phosphonomutase [Fusarium acutatum]|uniref:Carboxyphosphonoenolpyruvate phosphonomutase n=1 Tax=Fusarium acutatum TaxID=78861 RepID=A0A8H4JYB6_9HYPO|nr:carboxyphosphonoenolpyruvate phosphonomutase [Fusarium acutatum]
MESNQLAQTLKSLHIPSQPLIFANVWDLPSLNMVLCLNSEASKPVKAIATASWAFAASLCIKDEELTMEQNLASIRNLAATVASAGLPLSVDLQDGYGSRLREAVTQAIQAGAHGANIEDSIPARGLKQGIEHSLYPLSEQIRRLQLAVRAAVDAGLPDFVINARCDVFALKGHLNLNNEMCMKEAVRRGKAYLDAGATTVFFWCGYGAGFTEGDVQTLVKELDGRVAIRLGQTQAALSVSQLAKLGVARISVGPSLFQIAMDAAKKSAISVLEGGRLEDV